MRVKTLMAMKTTSDMKILSLLLKNQRIQKVKIIIQKDERAKKTAKSHRTSRRSSRSGGWSGHTQLSGMPLPTLPGSRHWLAYLRWQGFTEPTHILFLIPNRECSIKWYYYGLFIYRHSQGVSVKWFMMLPTSSIKKWVNLEKLFLTRFFKDDIEIYAPTLLAIKQKKGESIKMFVERFWGMTLWYPSDMT